MRIVLADLRGRDGFVSKDTVAGGYGSRLRPFSKTTELVAMMKQRTHDVPSVQLAYLAAMAAERGHDVRWTRDDYAEGDVAIVLSSLVVGNPVRVAAVAVSGNIDRKDNLSHRSPYPTSCE